MHACHLNVSGSNNVCNFWNNETDPVILMLKTTCCWIMMTNLIQREVLSFPFPFWVNCGVSPFSTHMNIRILSEAFEATESPAFHRAIALLRTDRDHEQKLVLTRLFALSSVAVGRIWCFELSQNIHCI